MKAMKMIVRVGRAIGLTRAASALALAGIAAAVGGCGSSGSGGGGPNFTVAPQYQPTAGAGTVDGKRLNVAVSFVDARVSKNRITNDGKEVLAEGDKGKVYLEKPLGKVFEEAMSAALRKSGFTVSADAPVVVEMSLVDMPLQAYQFTHWNLPSERASTLDAVGALLPGPVRPTEAQASMSVSVRKNNARLGFSHVAGGKAENKSDDRGIVEQTLSQAISMAVDDAVAKAAPDVEVVTRTPVSAKEIFNREEEMAKQQRAIKDLNDMLAKRDEMLVGDRKAAEEMKRQLEEDRKAGRESLTADMQKVEQQKTALQQERDALKAKVAELSAKPATDPAAAAALVKVKQEQADLEAKAKTVEMARMEVETRMKKIDEREQNLTAYGEKLKWQAQANQSLADELTARQKDITEREKALKNWKTDLDARANVKPPASIVEKRRPLILVTDPNASRSETTLGQVTVSGMAIDDRKVSALRVLINGKEIVEPIAAGSPGSKGVEIKPIPGPVHSADDSATSYALRRFAVAATLREGENEILIEATNEDNLKATEKLSVIYDKGGGRIHIITIGINDYQNRLTVPPLQYAVSDARGVANTLDRLTRTTDKQVVELLDGQATRANLVRQLFEKLPTEVKPADTVVIFFSGHGAPDAATDAAGNVETFLLPIDADPSKLFSTAIRMSDVGTILRRLRSERIVFLADTCYSGAARGGDASAGARTVSIPGLAMKGGIGIKAIPDRPKGKGCAIMTASTGTQVAQEKTDLQHGVFTHYLLEGLQGKADLNHDNTVTVDELYEYVRVEVGKATNGNQTPQISRDPSAGDIVLSVVK